MSRTWFFVGLSSIGDIKNTSEASDDEFFEISLKVVKLTLLLWNMIIFSFCNFFYFSSFLIIEDKNAHDFVSFYKVNPHEFDSYAFWTSIIKNEEKSKNYRNWKLSYLASICINFQVFDVGHVKIFNLHIVFVCRGETKQKISGIAIKRQVWWLFQIRFFELD